MSRIPLRDTKSQSSLDRPVAYLNGSIAAPIPSGTTPAIGTKVYKRLSTQSSKYEKLRST